MADPDVADPDVADPDVAVEDEPFVDWLPPEEPVDEPFPAAPALEVDAPAASERVDDSLWAPWAAPLELLESLR
ncbi:MAG: hypothetical protein ACRC35_07255 [Angustibacter sp.]